MSFTAIFNLRWRSFPSLPLIPKELRFNPAPPAPPARRPMHAAVASRLCKQDLRRASCRVGVPGALLNSKCRIFECKTFPAGVEPHQGSACAHVPRALVSGAVQHREKPTSSCSLCHEDWEEAAPAGWERLGFCRGGQISI